MSSSNKPDYHYTGAFDRAKFQQEFDKQFAKSARYNATALPDLLALLTMIERDINITDVREAAYMLATVMWETTSPISVTEIARNKKGIPLLDKKKNPIIVTKRKWLITMAPVSEIGHGKGRRYHEPVKVKQLTDGSVRITEQDGDQFIVSTSGNIKPQTKNAKMGTQDGGKSVKTYDDDDGSEQAYYGRGYVQLTWWSNYAMSGIALGRGLELLLNPELVKSTEVAYALMSHGMRTGQGFANGNKLSHYFTPGKTNYTSARHMVNGNDHAMDIAKLAKQFESILIMSRGASTAVSRLAGALP